METLRLDCRLEKEKSSLMWNYRFSISKEDADKIISNDRRIICTINDELKFNSGFIPDGKGHFYININKEIRNKLELKEGDLVHLEIRKDQSKYGMPIPPSFEELLNQDPEGEAFFNALSPGKIRSLLYVIGKPKSEQKQIEKGLVVLDYLKEVNGKLDFRELIMAFKNNRFR